MTTYPLPTLACTIDASGITAPAYADILLSLQASYREIYGSDVSLDPSTQDGQWLGIMALAISDSNAQTILAYEQASPATAIGNGLSSVVKINGMARLVASNSTAVVTIVGQAGTTISFGLIADDAGLGTQWYLPSSVLIPPGGSIDVTATCTTPGAITADANTLTVISTPTAGWQTVTNASNASPGQPVETDAELRARQALSTQNPAQTVVGAIYGDIANLTGVSAVSYVENVSGTTDGNGVPGHSIAFVVEGGALQDIVDVIGSGKAIGCGTYGTTTGTYVDPTTGVSYATSYSVATLKTITVAITLHALAGYSTAIRDEIKAAVAAYITDLAIASTVMIARLYVPAQLAGPYGAAAAADPSDGLTFELVSVAIAVSPGSPGSSDLVMAWNQRPICTAANVSVSVV